MFLLDDTHGGGEGKKWHGVVNFAYLFIEFLYKLSTLDYLPYLVTVPYLVPRWKKKKYIMYGLKFFTFSQEVDYSDSFTYSFT